MSKHPIGFRPSFPRTLILPEEHKRRKEESVGPTVDAVAHITLTDDDVELTYEDRGKEGDKEK